MITRMVLVRFASLEELRTAGQIDVLDKVLGRAKLLLTIEKRGKTTAAVDTISADVGALKEQISALTEQVAATQSAVARLCYRCHQPGHLQQNCPEIRRCLSCGQSGDLARDCQTGNNRGTSRMSRGRNRPTQRSECGNSCCRAQQSSEEL